MYVCMCRGRGQSTCHMTDVLGWPETKLALSTLHYIYIAYGHAHYHEQYDNHIFDRRVSWHMFTDSLNVVCFVLSIS